ncbi:MAG: replicative DNA helicase [Erysipelotrichaceae bacterium]|nr:replicative DNA helicase [Erysipelotrichaceae bacterium]
MNNSGLPHNIEAEKALIGSVFWSYASLQKVCEEVSSEVFYLDAHSKIFEVIKSLYQDKKPVDVGTVTSEIINKGFLLQIGGVEYLNSVVDSVATGANVAYYIDIVLEKFTLRRMIEVATAIITNASQADVKVGEAVEAAEKNILNISKLRKTSEFRSVREVLDKAQNDLEMLAKNKGKVTGLTTGLVDLDNLTNGFSPTQLIIVAARPAVGKTAFALNIACAAAKSTKKNIAVFSLEMPAEQLIMRMISSLGQIDNKKLQTGRLENEDWRRINEAISQLADTNIFFHDAGGVTASEIKAKCRRLSTQGEGLGLVIIDYLQLIDSSSKYSGSRQQEVSEISRSLKTMALELEVPVIALSQLSRSVEKREDKKPVLSDLRESGSIEQDADIVAALHAPDVEVPIDDNLPVPIQLIILKHRNGPIATIDMLFKKKTSTFLSIKKDGGNSAK